MYEKFHVTCLIFENKNYKKTHCLWWPWQAMKKWKGLKRILSILASFANFSNCIMTCWISSASGPHGGQVVAPVPTCNSDEPKFNLSPAYISCAINWGSCINQNNFNVSNAIHGNVYIFHTYRTCNYINIRRKTSNPFKTYSHTQHEQASRQKTHRHIWQ